MSSQPTTGTTALGPRIAQGRTAEVFAWHDGCVIKLFFDWCPAEWVQHELEIGQVLATLDLPTPKVMARVAVDGRDGLIYERVDGPSMLANLTAAPWRVGSIARSFAEVHAGIHQRPGGGFVRLHPMLEQAIDHSDAIPVALKAPILSTLRRLPEGTALCHFDFHPDQVLVTASGCAVIDWMSACQGDQLADVARTAILFMVGNPPAASWLTRAIIQQVRRRFYRTYLARYRELAPSFSEERLHAWMLPVAAARLTDAIPGEREPLLAFLQRAARP
ncbi:MAG: phosphotransferase [Kouleothrix sp.]|nr:phosphotransferase [Kouleothrix sp.]